MDGGRCVGGEIGERGGRGEWSEERLEVGRGSGGGEVWRVGRVERRGVSGWREGEEGV